MNYNDFLKALEARKGTMSPMELSEEQMKIYKKHGQKHLEMLLSRGGFKKGKVKGAMRILPGSEVKSKIKSR